MRSKSPICGRNRKLSHATFAFYVLLFKSDMFLEFFIALTGTTEKKQTKANEMNIVKLTSNQFLWKHYTISCEDAVIASLEDA